MITPPHRIVTSLSAKIIISISVAPLLFSVAVFTLIALTQPLTAGTTPVREPSVHQLNMNYLLDRERVSAATLLLNNSRLNIPLKSASADKIACIDFEYSYSDSFVNELQCYTTVLHITASLDSLDTGHSRGLSARIKGYNTIVIQCSAESLADPALVQFISNSQKQHLVILTVFGDFTSLQYLDKINHPVIISQVSSEVSARYTAQLIFGAAALSTRLALDISAAYPAGSGYSVTPVRLLRSVPEDAGVHSDKLRVIDEIVTDAINQGCTPGAVILVAKDGKIIFEKAYGTQSYEDSRAVEPTDIYDVASITKVAATTLAVMRMTEQQKIDLDAPLSKYLPETKKSDKGGITTRDLLYHEAGLLPAIAFRNKITAKDHRSRYSAAYNIRVTDNFFLRKNYYRSVMWPQILKSKSSGRGRYVYSDLSMFFVQEEIERRSGQKLDTYMQKNFYNPLLLRHTGFNAYKKFPLDKVVPSEIDDYFRNTTLRGYVQDPSAAMMGGVSAHAGLFTNANDLAVIFQMLLNRGTYGGSRFFEESTVDLFTMSASHNGNGRRKLGFDGYNPQNEKGYPSKLADPSVFGHTGFTGTCVWADPEHNLVYVFLSNRTLAGSSNKLLELEVRARVLDAVYEAID